MRLDVFLREAAARPMLWGEEDCSLFVANWVRARIGVDPAADLRGTYRCRFGAVRRIHAAGGLAALFAPRLEAAGLWPTRAARAGDVATVRAPGGVVVGAIRSASGWAAKTEAGLCVMPFQPLSIWTF